uniref:NADH dehydrogenase subunit 1 n=1 Tax=Discus perspectivus TaxID=697275 RepID=UPI002176A401|nr:NADH dehydrogenase subunit 1 [Discus perspectivus]UUB71738.1 NADH dehydrogenase subunit 1 [Discus perspectivus]
MVFFIMGLTNCLCIMLAVAYFTLLERKILGYIQNRKGPNKVGFAGFLQPISDAVKLLLKELTAPFGSNVLFFLTLPLGGLVLGLLLWYLYPWGGALSFPFFGGMIFLCLSSLSVYITMFSGWASNSLYTFLGALRASAQTISYEVVLATILIFPMVFSTTYSWNHVMGVLPVFCVMPMLFWVWMTSAFAETNRAPFDFAEGESELVSGFNTEFGGGLFALLFLGEYAAILFMSGASVVWFFHFPGNTSWMGILILGGLSLIFLIARGVYPRYRYDLLMMLCWKSLLPVMLSLLMFVLLF